MRGSNNKWPSNLHFVYAWPSDEQREKKLSEAIKQHPGTRLVVVDVWAKFCGPISSRQDKYQQDYNGIARLREVAATHGIAIIVVHHTRKGQSEDPIEEISGTNGLAGAADAWAVLKGVSGAGKVLVGSGRDIEEFELAVQFNRETCVWESLGPVSEIKSEPKKKILEALKKLTSAGPTEIAHLSTDAVKRLLATMVEEELLTKSGHGKYAVKQC